MVKRQSLKSDKNNTLLENCKHCWSKLKMQLVRAAVQVSLTISSDLLLVGSEEDSIGVVSTSSIGFSTTFSTKESGLSSGIDFVIEEEEEEEEDLGAEALDFVLFGAEPLSV